MSKPVPREAIPPSRKNLLIVNLRRNEIKTKCGTEGGNNLEMRQNLFWIVSAKPFFKLSRLHCEQVTDN